MNIIATYWLTTRGGSGKRQRKQLELEIAPVLSAPGLVEIVVQDFLEERHGGAVEVISIGA